MILNNKNILCWFLEDHNCIFCCSCSPLCPFLFLRHQDELSSSNCGSSKSSSPATQGSASKSGSPVSSQAGGSKSNSLMSSQGGSSKNTPTSTYNANSQSTTPLSPHDGVSAVRAGSASATSLSTAASDVTMESVDMPLHEQEVSDRLNKNLDRNNGKPESSKNITAVQEGQQSPDGQ